MHEHGGADRFCLSTMPKNIGQEYICPFCGGKNIKFYVKLTVQSIIITYWRDGL